MFDRDMSRRLALAGGALLAIACAWTGHASAAQRAPDPGFIHGFAEVSSDRTGYEKYVATTNRCTVTGTLLGIYDDEKAAPVGAVGAIAIGHTSFFYAKDFVFAFTKKRSPSVLYVPVGMKLPDELLK